MSGEKIIVGLHEALSHVKWQPIKTAPVDGTKIIVAWESRNYRGWVVQSSHFYRGRWQGIFNKRTCPSHWMPLPPPPHRETSR